MIQVKYPPTLNKKSICDNYDFNNLNCSNFDSTVFHEKLLFGMFFQMLPVLSVYICKNYSSHVLIEIIFLLVIRLYCESLQNVRHDLVWLGHALIDWGEDN